MFSYENNTPKPFSVPFRNGSLPVSYRAQSTWVLVGDNLAALHEVTAQPWWPPTPSQAPWKDELLPISSIFPLAFKKCVFPTVKESGACCPDKGRSSRRGQAVSLPRAAKRPRCVWDYCNPLGFSCSSSGYKAPASQLATLWKTTASQVLIIPLPVCALLLPVLWKSHDVNYYSWGLGKEIIAFCAGLQADSQQYSRPLVPQWLIPSCLWNLELFKSKTSHKHRQNTLRPWDEASGYTYAVYLSHAGKE